MGSQMNSKGQVTIFIILGIVIVLGILAAFIFREDIVNVFSGEVEVQTEIQTCVEEVIQSAIPPILANGGDLSPEKTLRYRSVNYTYLCYQDSDYLPCYNLNPLLRKSSTELIYQNTKDQISSCIENTLEDARAKGYTIEEENLNYSLSLVPGKLRVNILKPISISREESVLAYSDFSFELKTKLYEILNMMTEISNYESQYCDFDRHSYMLLYPEWNITRITYDYSKIYSVLHIDSKEKTKFAVRGCVIPPGL